MFFLTFVRRFRKVHLNDWKSVTMSFLHSLQKSKKHSLQLSMGCKRRERMGLFSQPPTLHVFYTSEKQNGQDRSLHYTHFTQTKKRNVQAIPNIGLQHHITIPQTIQESRCKYSQITQCGFRLPTHYLVVLFNSKHYRWTQSMVNGNHGLTG